MRTSNGDSDRRSAFLCPIDGQTASGTSGVVFSMQISDISLSNKCQAANVEEYEDGFKTIRWTGQIKDEFLLRFMGVWLGMRFGSVRSLWGNISGVA